MHKKSGFTPLEILRWNGVKKKGIITMNKRQKSLTGFTLIELVMVIVILGILAGVAIPTFVNLQSSARASACKGALGGLRSGISIWYAKTASSGTAAWPSLTDLSLSVMASSRIPANPYAGDGTKNNIGEAASPTADTNFAWIYYATTGDIWATGGEATAF